MKTNYFASSLVVASLFVAAVTIAQSGPSRDSVAGAAKLNTIAGQSAATELRFENIVKEKKVALVGELKFEWAKPADKLGLVILVSPANQNLVPGKLTVTDNVAKLEAKGRMRVIRKGVTKVYEGKVETVITDMGKTTPDGFVLRFTPKDGGEVFNFEAKTAKGNLTVKKASNTP
jgi:hypothetical protein